MAKSKKRSGSNGPPEQVFFVDRDLGRAFVQVLRQGGLRVEAHDDHFRQDSPDEEWLLETANREWIVLTHDAKIRYTSRAKEAILAARARVIVLKGKSPTARMAEAFLLTLKRVLRFLKKQEGPFIAKLYPNLDEPNQPGRIELWFDRDLLGR